LQRSLAAAHGGQDEVIASLERLIGELSVKADYRRAARLLAELREDQLAHEKSTRAEIDVSTLPLEINELTRAQRADLSKAAAGQAALTARFEQIEQNMDQLARQLAKDQDPMAGTISDAVALARQLAIGADMKQSGAELGENHVGQALERESKV